MLEREVRGGQANCSVYVAWHHQTGLLAESSLDDQERHRLNQLRSPGKKVAFRLGVALLKLAVAKRLGSSPASVHIDRTCDRCGEPHGRPRVIDSALSVSVSHSGHAVIVCTSDHGPVGVDIEWHPLDGDFDYRSVVELACAPEERPFVHTNRDFFTIWTRKEALLKATGEGLAVPLDRVVMSSPEHPARLLSYRGDRSVPAQLSDFVFGRSYSGAVASLSARPLTVEVLSAQAQLSDRARRS